MSWQKIIRMNVCVVSLYVSSTAFAITSIPEFAGGEHVALGDKVRLSFSDKDSGKTNQLLPLPNGLQLSYGEIVTLGDFYGAPGQPISEALSQLDKEVLFTSAFMSLAESPKYINQTKDVLAVIHDEENAVIAGMENGEMPEDVYAKMNGDNNRKYNCITGGGCSGAWWLQAGSYLELAKTDFDHFGENAWVTYEVGHKLALKQALYAHQVNDVHQLEIAYAMNAFASHFLSDRFSSGHIRTPRLKLQKMLTPEVVGSVLANYMHTEENRNGLHVHNARGDHWTAYGDTMYFNEKNEKNRELLQEALQASADQVFATYLNGLLPATDNVVELIPQADFVENRAGADIAPLFYWDETSNTLFRREVTSDINDHHWTSNWWGWSTLLQLTRERGLPVESQGELIRAGYGKEAMRMGLISDPTAISYLQAQ